MTPIEAKDQRVCFVCVMEQFLSEKIEKEGANATCSYCGQEGSTFSINQIAQSITTILEDFYHRTDYDVSTDPPEGTPVEKLIKELTETEDSRFADDVRCLMAQRYAAEREEIEPADNPFGIGVRYARSESIYPWEFEHDWQHFENSLKTETRYFNRQVEQTLVSVFEGIDDFRTKTGRPIVLEAGPGTELAALYRAREFQTEKELRDAMKHPEVDVGPPPKTKAQAGRMNAAGIAVFYGATDPEMALAEIRPPVGSKVLIARFEIVRPLKLLDLTALNEVRDDSGSLFDSEYRRRLQRAHFLRGLSQRISKPVMPNDQPLEYLPTQAIADFLATADCPPLPLDGIVGSGSV